MQTIKTSIDERGVGTILLHRPSIHNAFDEIMIEEISELLREWNQRDTLRLILMRGEGKSFCAGADVNWMKKMCRYNYEENVEDALKMSHMFTLLNSVKVPVLGYVHGFALGGAMGLISCCDYVLAHPDASFGLTEAVLGLIPAVISPFVLSKIGETYARAYMLSGHQFPAPTAVQMGLIHEIHEKDADPSSKIEALIKTFLRAGPMAQRKAKFLIQEVLRDLFQKGLKEDFLTNKTANFIAQTRVSSEAQEGMGALLEKRTPRWRSKEP